MLTVQEVPPINGQIYRILKLSARDQFELMLSVAPLLPALAALVQGVKDNEEEAPEGEKDEPKLSMIGKLLEAENLPQLLQPLADAMKSLKKGDGWDIVVQCMGVVQKKEGSDNNVMWSNVWNPNAGDFQFKDMKDFSIYLPLVTRVISFNLGPSIAALLSDQSEKAATSTKTG